MTAVVGKHRNTANTTDLIAETNWPARTQNSRTHSTCDIRVSWLPLLAPEAGDFVELTLLYCNVVYIVIRLWIIKSNRGECGFGLFQDTFSAFFRARYENISDHDNWLQLSKTDLLTLTLAVQFVVIVIYPGAFHVKAGIFVVQLTYCKMKNWRAYCGASCSLLHTHYYLTIKSRRIRQVGLVACTKDRRGNLRERETCKT